MTKKNLVLKDKKKFIINISSCWEIPHIEISTSMFFHYIFKIQNHCSYTSPFVSLSLKQNYFKVHERGRGYIHHFQHARVEMKETFLMDPLKLYAYMNLCNNLKDISFGMICNQISLHFNFLLQVKQRNGVKKELYWKSLPSWFLSIYLSMTEE